MYNLKRITFEYKIESSGFMKNNNCDYCIWQRLTKDVKTICVNNMSPNCDKIVTDKDCCLYFCEEK